MTYHPADNDWNPGGGTLGLWPAGWIPIQPWTSEAGAWTSGSGGGTGFTAKTFSTDPVLFDAYQSDPSASAQPGNIDAPPSSAVVTTPTNGEYGGFYLENAELTNTLVQANFYTSHPTGQAGAADDDLAAFGIGCRLRDGTLAGTSTVQDSYVNALDGYWFVQNLNEFGSGGAALRYQLLRVNGGVATKLTEYPTVTNSGSGLSLLNLDKGRPFRLTMSVSGTGATVTIVCKVTYWYNSSFAGLTNYGEVLELIDHSDTDANRITGAGRVGLLQHPANLRSSSGVISVPKCGYVRANEIGSPFTINDRWLRTHKNMGRRVTSTNTGSSVIGYSLQSAFFADWHGYATLAGRITFATAPVTGSNCLQFYYNDMTPSQSLPCVQTRNAEDKENQDRSIDYYFDGTGSPGTATDETGRRSVAIMLREDKLNWTSGAIQGCYLVEIGKNEYSGAVPMLWVYRYTPGANIGSRLLLASMENPGGTADGTWNTLRARVEAVGGAAHNDAAKISIWLNGSAITGLEREDIDGIVIDSDGAVVDDTSERLLEGTGEGFYVKVADITGGNKTYIDNWGQGALTSNDTPENEQASIAVSSETDGATGTLTLPASWGLEVIEEWDSIETEFELPQYRQGLARQSRSRRRWKASSSATASSNEEGDLRDFWNDHGQDVPFTWTPPGEAAAITAHFSSDYTRVLRGPGVEGFEIEIEELF